MYNFNFMYVMKKLLLIFIVLFTLIGSINSQEFLGKNKAEVKAKFLERIGNGEFTKSFGYDAYVYISYLKDMDIVIFNSKGICFLECHITKDKKFVDVILYNFCNSDKCKVYQINPSVNKKHEFIEGKTTMELVVESNNPAMINARYDFYIFNSEYKQDVLNYFEKRFSKEYAIIKEKEIQAERQKQAELKRQKEVENILSTLNRDVIVEEKVHDYYTNKLLKDSEYWDVLEKPKKEKIDTIVNVLIHVDSLNTNVVSIAGDDINKGLSSLYWKDSQHHYCTINGINYSKYQNSVFYSKNISVKTKSLEKGIYGVEKKKDKFKYYKTVPNEVQEWCRNNITKNGFYAIQYTNYGGKYTIELIDVTKDVKKILQGKDPQKNKKIWTTIGSIGGSILLLGGIIALKVI